MSLKTSLKHFFVEHRARWFTSYGEQRALSELSAALQKDDPRVLEQALKDSLRWLSVKEIDRLKFKLNVGGIESEVFSWKGAMPAAGRWKCVEWALNEGKVTPDEFVPCSGFKTTFKRLLWWTKFTGHADMSCWIGHAKAHPQSWRPEWERLKDTPEAKELGWLKLFFAQEQEFEKYFDFLSKKHVEKVSESVEDSVLRGESVVIENFVEPKKDETLLKYAKAWNEDPHVLDRDGFSSTLVSSFGPSTSVFKGFVELGWCSLQDVQEFQQCVRRHDKALQNVGQAWGRPDLVAWVEKELLSKRVGHVQTPSHQAESLAL